MSNTKVQPQEIKAPKTLAVREAVPWFIVTIMTCVIVGLIAGWFFHASVTVTNHEVLTAAVSKAVQ